MKGKLKRTRLGSARGKSDRNSIANIRSYIEEEEESETVHTLLQFDPVQASEIPETKLYLRVSINHGTVSDLFWHQVNDKRDDRQHDYVFT